MIDQLISPRDTSRRINIWQMVHIDLPLLLGLLALSGLSLVILYSASDQDVMTVLRQALRLGLGFVLMLVIAQVDAGFLMRWTPWLYGVGLVMLLLVLLVGDTSKGAQRWLDLGIFRFQPSEMMKLAVPMMMAWYLHQKPLPPSYPQMGMMLVLILVPVLMVAKQPDLGTAILIAGAGVFVMLLSGIPKRLIAGGIALVAAAIPVIWHFLHDYQRQRVLTFIDPEKDPLGSGYHIIQSKIAIGSGGLFGKGLLNGTQSQLDFLPERHTDFIFAVFAEEFGFAGFLALIMIYLFVVARGIFIATQAQDTYSRLLAGSLALIFFVYVFVNIGMVSGLLPVVGVPLPLISYGGTSLVTLMAGFGILMSIHTHRKLLGT